jgi:HD-like signal output (HDOD) protein
VDNTLMTRLWDRFIDKAQLVSLPAVYLRLKAVLDDTDFSMADVEAVLSQDPAMTARLLRQVNSPYFGFAARIDTVSRAVGMLGTQQVHDLVLTASIAETFPSESSEVMDMHHYWRRSVYCAAAARLLAARCKIRESERLFLAGLLRDIGHLVMYQSLADVTQLALTQARQQCRPLYVVEREVIGFDYGKAGGTLLQHWQLPQSLWEPVALHVTPDKATDYALDTAIIHQAGVMADLADADTDKDTNAETQHDALISMVHPCAWQITGLAPEQFITVKEEADQQIDEVMSLIFPRQATRRSASM